MDVFSFDLNNVTVTKFKLVTFTTSIFLYILLTSFYVMIFIPINCVNSSRMSVVDNIMVVEREEDRL